MLKNKYKIKKWVILPIFLLMCSLCIGFGFVKPTRAFQTGVTIDDIPNEYYSLTPSSITAYVDGQLFNSSAPLNSYTAINLPQRIFPEIANLDNVGVGTYETTETLSLADLFLLDNWLFYSSNSLGKSFTSVYKKIVVPYEYLLNETAFVCFEYDDLILPSYNGAVNNMATSFLEWYRRASLSVLDGDFVYMTCDVNFYIPYLRDDSRYIIPHTFSYELTFDSSMQFVDVGVAGSTIILYDMFTYIENDLIVNRELSMGQYLLYFSNVKIYGSTTPFTTDETDMMFGYITPYIEKENHSFFNDIVTPVEAYHSYYLSINDWFLNPNIPPLVITDIESVDVSTFLLDSVGAFINAELFPGFSIGGVLAVLVAFPLAIWLLKVALGG